MPAEGQVPSHGIRYRSKVDGWLVAVLIAAFLLVLLVLFSVVVFSRAFATVWWV
jgi:hypothetical protein